MRCFRIGPLADADGLCLLRRAGPSTARQALVLWGFFALLCPALPWRSLARWPAGWLRDDCRWSAQSLRHKFFSQGCCPSGGPLAALTPQPLVGRGHAAMATWAPWVPRIDAAPSLDGEDGP